MACCTSMILLFLSFIKFLQDHHLYELLLKSRLCKGYRFCITVVPFSRSRLGIHCIPSSCSHDASAPTVVHLLLCHAHSLGSGHTSKTLERTNSFWKTAFAFSNVLPFYFLQFVAMEVVMTSIIDMFPGVMRRAGRREGFLLLFCLICFFSQLVMITEVSI